jgi:hypothetical protein
MPPNKKTMKMVTGRWIDEIVAATGQYIRLETSDGIRREGRLSGLRTRALKWEGEQVLIPTEVEINGDPSDTVPLDRISSIELL